VRPAPVKQSKPTLQKPMVQEFEQFHHNMDEHQEQLMTEEDEQVFRQVASDINENAFFGK
jgi:hypothetical protein